MVIGVGSMIFESTRTVNACTQVLMEEGIVIAPPSIDPYHICGLAMVLLAVDASRGITRDTIPIATHLLHLLTQYLLLAQMLEPRAHHRRMDRFIRLLQHKARHILPL